VRTLKHLAYIQTRGSQTTRSKPVNLRGLTIIDQIDTTRRGRIATISTAGYIVTVQWAVGDVRRVNVTAPRSVVEVPLWGAAPARAF
jgi:hypothetical protein